KRNPLHHPHLPAVASAKVGSLTSASYLPQSFALPECLSRYSALARSPRKRSKTIQLSISPLIPLCLPCLIVLRSTSWALISKKTCGPAPSWFTAARRKEVRRPLRTASLSLFKHCCPPLHMAPPT